MLKKVVLSSQPKRKGINKHWVNIHIHGEDDSKAVNWAYVAESKPKISPSRELRLTSEEQISQPVIDAKNTEYNNLITNKVFDEVPYEANFNSMGFLQKRSLMERRLLKPGLLLEVLRRIQQVSAFGLIHQHAQGTH